MINETFVKQILLSAKEASKLSKAAKKLSISAQLTIVKLCEILTDPEQIQKHVTYQEDMDSSYLQIEVHMQGHTSGPNDAIGLMDILTPLGWSDYTFLGRGKLGEEHRNLFGHWNFFYPLTP